MGGGGVSRGEGRRGRREEKEGEGYWSRTPPTLLPKPCNARTFPLASRAKTSRRSASVSLHFSSEYRTTVDKSLTAISLCFMTRARALPPAAESTIFSNEDSMFISVGKSAYDARVVPAENVEFQGPSGTASELPHVSGVAAEKFWTAVESSKPKKPTIMSATNGRLAYRRRRSSWDANSLT